MEDEWIIADQISRNLEKFGYKVLSYVSSGAEALEMAAKEKPDLILMDIMLHGVEEGIATAAKITEEFDLPVIFLTAYADVDLIEKAKLTKPYGYLVKPFGDNDLPSAIEVAIYKHEADKDIKERHKALKKNLAKTIDVIANMT